MGKDSTKPISFKAIQKNKKLGEFVSDDITNIPLDENTNME